MKKLTNFGKAIFSTAALLLTVSAASAQKTYDVSSPDGKVKAVVKVGKDAITYKVVHSGQDMVLESPVSMTLSDGTVYGGPAKVKKISVKKVDATIPSPVYKKSSVRDNYYELTIHFRGDFNLVFRAYDDGVAYRFVSLSPKPFEVASEQAVFNFPEGSKAWIPYVKRGKTLEDQKFTSFENWYEYIPLSGWDKERLAFMPLLVDAAGGKKVCITEADLLDYPGMFLYNGDGGYSVAGVFAEYPKEVEQGGHNNLQMIVRSREGYLAKYDKGAAFPWRVIVVSDNDARLADSDMVYRLASANRIGDTSWIGPGKVAWDWWNHWNLYGVDFETGVNNDTYKYYIDFASQRGIEYVILDEGWAVNKEADLFKVVPEIDLPMIVRYAAERNVGIILWAGYWAFDRDMERVCKHYSEMGVKGFKVDFMDRDDQVMVDFHRRGAEMAAKYKLMIDYHGTYKPTGLQRTYPNVVNFEGVNGLEQLKWSRQIDQVTYDVTIPFIRMVAGPMDYTQGAMRNATNKNYAAINSEAMSQGTRCRQLAQYVVFESPLNMLCDSPSNYEREEECTEFIATIPTVWDQTVSLEGKVGEYVAIARRSGHDWYVGGMTDWNAREMTLDLSFLEEGRYKAELFRDGVNADKAARDYKKEAVAIPADRKITVRMAPGGGFAMKITRKLPEVIAHRGYWKTEGSAQNSLRSFYKADSIGCYGSEIDVWFTADNELVVNHDRVYQGVSMETASAAEITAVRLGNGEFIPMLETMLMAVKGTGNTRLVYEAKSIKDVSRIPAATSQAISMLRKYGLVERTDVIAFSHEYGLEFIKQLPGTKVFHLNGDLTPAQLKAEGYAGLDYSVKVMKKNPQWVNEAHELGLEVNVWTVNSKEDMEYFISLGVDYITTDEPELLQSVLRQ